MRNAPGGLEHLPVERSDRFQVDRDRAEIDLLAFEQPPDQRDRLGDEGRRIGFPGVAETGPDRRRIGLGKGCANNKAAAPQEGAAAYRRFEKDEARGLIRNRRPNCCCAAARPR
jgi:hypothetical protein